MEAKDVCSRASGKVKTYLIPPHCFVIFFEHCTFCTIVIKGTFLAIIWFCKRQLRICQVESMTPEYPLLEFLFITPNNSTQIQNVCMEIYWYTFCHLSLSLHKTQSWLYWVRANSGPNAVIAAPRLRDTYGVVIVKRPNCFSNYCKN